MSEQNTLYFGDNLEILRRYVKDETVDLVYLDPPFKSNRAYNLLFTERDGSRAAAQMKAFNDTWRWDTGSEAACQAMIRGGGSVGEAILALRRLLGPTDMMAYLAMMAPRLVELRRVMKQMASIYLHCDPTASHYLKLLMDAVFDPRNFRNEIVWKRFSSKNDPRRYGRTHDIVLFYTRNANFQWHRQYGPFEPDYVGQNYRYTVKETGRRYRLSDLTANKPGGDVDYEWHGMRPYKGRHWAFSKENMDRMLAEGRIVFRRTGMPVYKRYLDEMPGVPLQDIWTDIKLDAGSRERIGYPTQKPAALLRRIVTASTAAGDVVLDPFCGCGTAIVVAEQLKRRWIGIDITHLAIEVVQQRLRRDINDEVVYRVQSEPKALPDAIALAKRDRFHFQTWALGLVGARTGDARRGSDRGIDGRITDEQGRVALVSVKSGKVTVSHVRDLRGVVEREGALLGVLVTLYEPTRAMVTEAATAGAYDTPQGIIPRVQILTVAQLLDPKGRGVAYPPPTAPVRALPRPRVTKAEQFRLPLMAQISKTASRPRQLRMEEVEEAVPWQMTSPSERRGPSRAAGRRASRSARRRRRRAS